MEKIIILLITITLLLILSSCSNKFFTTCTQELKICPDGTGVGRIGPNCEFALCPQFDPKLLCEKASGVWKSFPNTCVDSCEKARAKERVFCGQAFTDGCDCGPDKCWNGKSCEDN